MVAEVSGGLTSFRRSLVLKDPRISDAVFDSPTFKLYHTHTGTTLDAKGLILGLAPNSTYILVSHKL